VSGQLLHPKLASYHVANPHHRVFDVVDVLRLTVRFFLCQQLRHQRFHTFLDDLVSCHPWLPYLI
jgi:hypothetical protein